MSHHYPVLIKLYTASRVDDKLFERREKLSGGYIQKNFFSIACANKDTRCLISYVACTDEECIL